MFVDPTPPSASIRWWWLAEEVADPEQQALVDGDGRVISRGELATAVKSTAARLVREGIQRSDRLALAMAPGPAQAVGVLAGMAVAAVAPLAQTAPLELVREDLRRLRVTHVVIDHPGPGAVIEAAEALGLSILTLDPLGESPANSGPLPSAGPEDLALLMQSSGTTGRPKVVPLTHANLLAGAHAVGNALNLGPADRTLAAMPLFHIHGIVATLLAPLQTGGSVICCRNPAPAELWVQLSSLKPTWFSASPTLLLALLEEVERRGVIPPPHFLRLLRSVTMPLAPAVRERLEAVFRVPVLAVYGMTEAASQVCSTRLPGDGPLCRPGSVGAAAGPEVAVLGPDRRHCPPGMNGEVGIRGPSVTRGYEGEEHSAWVHDAAGVAWFLTGDVGSIDDAGHLTLSGRVKEMINRGGMKVLPQRVDEALLRHPAVADAAAFPIPHPTLGEDVAAAVVLREGATVAEQDLRNHVIPLLPTHEVPSRIIFVPALPRGATGKRQRIGMAERFADALRPSATPAEGQMEQLVESTFTEILNTPAPGRHANFFLIGGDSLSAQVVLQRLEVALGLRLETTLVFTHPTIEGLAKRLGELVEGPSEPPVNLPAAVPIPGVGSPGVLSFPASFSQSRLWFLHRLKPDLTAYHLVGIWRLRGPLDSTALAKALDALVERHAALRTAFRRHGDLLLQQIHPACAVPLATEHLDGRDPEAVIDDWLLKERATPFDLTSGLLIRARLLVVKSEEHFLLLTHHHIASDAWSGTVLARDLSALYNAALANRTSTLQPLVRQYYDYAVWQRANLQGQRLQDLRNYWARQLARAVPLVLPTDAPRTASPSYRGGTVPFRIESALLAPLESLCRSEGATLQMGLLAALTLVLHHHSREDDVTVGIPYWGRSQAGLDHLIGCFVNTLPIRTRLKNGASFRELLRQVRDTSIAAYAHHDLPFEQIVDVAEVERDTSRSPLVQVLMQFSAVPAPSLRDMHELQTERLRARPGSVRFELECFLQRDQRDGLRGEFHYATDLFHEARIKRLASHLLTLIHSLISAPDIPATSLNLLPDSERSLIESWQHGVQDEREDGGIHELFEEQVTRTPDAIAVVFGNQRLTYVELDQRTNRLAHELVAQGAGFERVVAVCLERSTELIVALLAILKAGSAYLPLDPGWPAQRRQLLLHASRADLLITRNPEAALGAPPHVRIVDPTSANLNTRPPHRPTRNRTRPGALAYLLYTSGSTGTPKGVQSEHSVLTNLIRWHQSDPRLGTPARTLQFASCVFDVSLQEIFSTFCTGGTLVLIEETDRHDLRQLCLRMEEAHVERLFLPCVALEQLATHAVDLAGEGRLQLRDIVSAGDKLSLSDAILRLLKSLPSCRLHNHYGPTESHVVTAWPLDPAELSCEGNVSIGRPIRNTTIRVLNPAGHPCPIGVPGELHIGGAGLARGYIDNDALTSERFLSRTGLPGSASRLYRSGDLASWNENGTLAFHGRIDQQVKLRGFRIEPREIEVTLLTHPDIAQVAVVLRKDDPTHPRLVAYWVPRGADANRGAPGESARLSTTALRDYLSQRLPDYMVPTAFVPLGCLPLTENAKLDYKALPAPSFAGDQQQRIKPGTAIERELHRVWTKVLGHGDFGVTDNFFTVGGDSLATTQLIAELEQTLGGAPQLAALFRHPTIADQARAIAAPSAQTGGCLVRLQPEGTRAPLFIIHGLGGDVWGWIPLARALAPERPVIGVQALGAGRAAPQQTTVREMAAEYAAEILRVRPTGPIHLLGYSAGGWYAHAVAEALLERHATLGILGVLDTHPTARIHGRLRPIVFLHRLRMRLVARFNGALRRPEGQPLSQYLFRYLGKLSDRVTHPRRVGRSLTVHWRNTAGAIANEGDPFSRIHGEHRPTILPIGIDLFATPASQKMLRWMWSFYARRGVRCHTLFSVHRDFYKPENAPKLAESLESAMTRVEADKP